MGKIQSLKNEVGHLQKILHDKNNVLTELKLTNMKLQKDLAAKNQTLPENPDARSQV